MLVQIPHPTVSYHKQKGIIIGTEKGKIEVARNSLKAGISMAIIAEITGLTHDEIAQLED